MLPILGFKRKIRAAPNTNVIEWTSSPFLVKWAKDFHLKLDPSQLKKCLRSEPRFRKNYLTELLQNTLIRCDVKSSKSLKSFLMELFFRSGLRNTRSLVRGDRYQHQDNPIVSLVLLNNANWYPPMYTLILLACVAGVWKGREKDRSFVLWHPKPPFHTFSSAYCAG